MLCVALMRSVLPVGSMNASTHVAMSVIGRLGAAAARHRRFTTAPCRRRHAVLGGILATCVTSCSTVPIFGFAAGGRRSVDAAAVSTELRTDNVQACSSALDLLFSVREETARVIAEPLASLWETSMMTLRALRLLATFAPLICLYVPVYFVPGAQRIWWSVLLSVVESSGPVFIKLGQWASTRRDLFSADFCDQFARLQRSVRPHSWSFTCRRLDEALGPIMATSDWRQAILFDRASPDEDAQPIGSGCVAQVYRARLRLDLLAKETQIDVRPSATPSSTWTSSVYLRKALAEGLENWALRLLSFVQEGHLKPSVEDYAAFRTLDPRIHTESLSMLPVAVKVLHPGIQTSFRRDLTIIKTFVDVAEALVPGLHWLNLSRCVEEFADVMRKQIDLSAEARNLDLFARNFSDVTSVRFPVPVRPLVSHDVLVETFEEGEQMLQFTRDVGEQSGKRNLRMRLADIGIDAVFKMVFADNFVHGDLHPGNILVQNATAKDEQDTRLVFLDCGITASLEDTEVENMLSVFNAVVLGNGEMVGELFLKHTRDHRCSDATAFKRDMAKIVDDFQQSQRHSKEASVSTVIGQLFGTLIRHRVQLEGNFAIVILSMMIIEGLGHSLKPDMDVLAKAQPFLVAARLRRALKQRNN